MKVRGVDFVYYAVKNFKRSLTFYTKTLGLKPLEKPGKEYAELTTGTVALVIGKWGKPPTKNSPIALAVDNVPAAVKELKRKKVKIVMELYESKVCYMAIIKDPDGNEIMLHQRKDGTVG